MKKIAIAVLAAFGLTASVFAADVEMSFKNKLSSDIVNVVIPSSGNSTTEFAGVKDRVSAEFLSEKVDALIDLEMYFSTVEAFSTSKNELYTYGLLYGYDFKDSYIEFRPIEILTLGFRDTISTNGSYLPVEDDNVGNGNLGSDFVLCLRPIKGLRAAAGIDFVSFFGNESAKGPLLNFGIDYTNDAFSIGAAARNVIADFGFGIFGSLTAVEGLNLTAGFAYNDEFCDIEGNILTFGAAYDFTDALSTALDCVTNFGNKDAGKLDLYTGVNVTFAFTEAFEAGVTCTFKTDFDADDSYEVGISPEFAYTVGNNTFKLGADIGIGADETTLAFPISWTYAF